MHKHKYYRPPKPSTLPQKPIDMQSRPQFTTDFSEPDKYKLSQAQMIQKKAALQSKNRQIARTELQQRRRKLQMGIIDEDTRKVFQTALQSKKIDLNPSIRRNLSQMIQYQRQRSSRKKSKGSANKRLRNQREQQNSQQQNQSSQQNYDKQIKNTQQFIKKLQKAKKQQNIGKAVDILMNDKRSQNFGPTKSNTNYSQVPSKLTNNILKNSIEGNNSSNMNGSRMTTISQQQTLSNIEQTIKFMQQKLFNTNWKKTKQQPSQKQTKNPKTLSNRLLQPMPQRPMQQTIKNSTISQISYDQSHNQFLLNCHTNNNLPNMKGISSPIANRMHSSKAQLNKLGFGYGHVDEQDQQSFNMSEQLHAFKAQFQSNLHLDLQENQESSYAITGTFAQNLNKYLKDDIGVCQDKQKSGQFSELLTKGKKSYVQEKYSQEYQQDDDDCLATIRKMKEMMQQKAELYDNLQNKKYKQNVNRNNYVSQRSNGISYKSQGDVQVDFSLTMNQDEIQIYNNVKSKNNNDRTLMNNSNKNNKIDNIINTDESVIHNVGLSKKSTSSNASNNISNRSEYEQLKRSLFEQIQKLQKQQSSGSVLANTLVEQNSTSFKNISNASKKNLMSNTSSGNNFYMHQQQQQDSQQYHVPTPAPIQYQLNNKSNKPIIGNTKKNINIGSLVSSNEANGEEKNYKKKQTQPKINKELEQLKNIVHGTKNNVNSLYSSNSGHNNTQKIEIIPYTNNKNSIQTSKMNSMISNNSALGMGNVSMMGFDYRGSINIKKHIISSNQIN